MREIKFKVWNTETKKYMYPNDPRHGDYSISVLSGKVRGKYGDTFPNFIAKEYTGINDKNEVEIYEGDEVKILITKGVVHKGVVVFEKGAFCLKSKSDLGKDKYNVIPFINYAHSCVITKL
jgi:uncharacterized phage protein (TIGR01671 family)